MITLTEYPPFVTVIRVYDKFCATVMTWNPIQERYETSRYYAKSRKRKTTTEAKIDAEMLARKLDMELR